MTWRWPSLRTLRRTAIGLVAALLVSLLLLRLFVMTPIARSMAETRIEAMTIRGQSVELEGFKGDLLGRLSFASLSVRDADGVWAKADNVEMAWGPLGLLSGHLRLKEIAADTLSLSRRPNLAPSSGGGGGSFLNRYTVQSLNVPALSLSQGIAGPEQAYALTGRLEAGGRQGEAALDLSPLEGRGDRALVDLKWGGEVPLIGQVEIDGVPGGLIATILQAPAQAGVTILLDASGTLYDWQLSAEGTVGEQSILDLDASRLTTGYAVQGRLDLAQLDQLTALTSRLGDRVAFRGALDTENQLSGEINAETLNSSFSGRVQQTDGQLTVEALSLEATDVSAGALTGQSDLDLAAFTADGTLTLSSDANSFDGEIRMPRLAYRDYSLAGTTARGTFAIDANAVSMSAIIEADRITGLPARLQKALDRDARLDVIATLDRASRTISVNAATLKARKARASGSGTYQLGGAVALSGDIALEDSAPVERFDGTWSIQGADLNTALIRLNGAVAFDQSIDALPQIVGGDGQLSLAVQREQSGLVIQKASLQSAQIDAKATGAIKQGQVAISGDLAAPDLTLSTATLNQLKAQFDLTGPTQSPKLALTASAAELVAQGRKVQAPHVTGEIELTGDTAFSWRASATYLDAPITLEIDGARRDGIIDLTRIAADWADLQANGAAALNPSDPRTATIDLAVTGSPPTLGDIDAQVSYRDERLDGKVRLESATFGPVSLKQSQIDLNGTWPQFSGALTYQADLPVLGENRPIAGSHGINANADRREITLDGGLTLASQDFVFITPLNIALSEGLKITGRLAAFNGEIDLSLQPLSETPSQFTLTDLALQKFGPLINRPALLGTVNGSADIALIDGQLNGAINATVANLARGTPDAPSADLRLAALISDNQFDAALRTEDADQTVNFTALLSAPLIHQGQVFTIRPAPDAPVSVSLKGEGSIAPLWALAAPTDLRLDGDLSLDINNGDGTSWRFQGPARFENGAFEDGITGLHLREIDISAGLRPDGIDIETAAARGRNSGRVEASGLYGFDGNGSVTLQLRGLNAFKRSDVSATVSGRAEIDRQNRRTQISGDLEIDEARVNLEKLPGAGYTTLDVVFADDLNEDTDQTPEREAIVLDLDISAARRIFVVGSGADTEWGLNVRVTGSPGRPNVIGRADLVRGEADLLSRRFRFSEGLVQFVGVPSETELRLRADRTSDDITSSITLSGTMMDPEISLSADPSLPDDEILARVLFGRSPSELSPLQAAQLAGAAAQLAGGDALNLVGQLQEATGLDRLDFGLNEDGAATLSTGKYIAEDVYLEIETGGTGAPGVALEWTPLENVAVDAEVDPELGPKVAIQWKRDFDRLPGEEKSD